MDDQPKYSPGDILMLDSFLESRQDNETEEQYRKRIAEKTCMVSGIGEIPFKHYSIEWPFAEKVEAGYSVIRSCKFVDEHYITLDDFVKRAN
jgi:hypothetical protein